MNIEELTFKELVDLGELKELFEKFSTATGFTIGLIDHTTQEVLLDTGWLDICAKFHRTGPESQKQCVASSRALTSGLSHAGEIKIHHCKNGLVDGCTPLIIQDKHFADLFSGQVLFSPPDKEQFRIQAQKYGYDEQTYLKSLSDVPVISEEKFTAILEYLVHTATMIARTGLAKLKIHKESTEREALLQSIFKSAPVGIGLVVNRVICWTNQKMCEITGYSSAELKGANSLILYPSKEEFERVGQEKYNQIRANGTGSVDTHFKRKDGSIIDIHLSSTPVDPKDLSAGVTFTALDITDRKNAIITIQENEQRLQLALEGAKLGTWDWNMQTDEVYFDHRYFSMLGYGPVELPHTLKTWENLLHPEDRTSVKQQIFDCIENGSGQWSTEFRLQAKDGHYKWILGQGKIVEYSKDSSPLRASGTHLDITPSKTIELSLMESEERFREIFNNMGSGVAIYEATEEGNDFIFKDLNRAGLISSKLEHHQIVGKNVQEIFPSIKTLGLLDVFRRVWKTGIPENLPSSFYKDGRVTLWVENYVCKLPSGEVVAIYDDITERKRVEDEIIRAKEEWVLTFDAMSDIVTIQDKDMRIIRANKAAYDFFQVEHGELENKFCYEIFTGTKNPCPDCPLFITLQDINKHSGIMNHENLGKIFHVSSSAITADSGEIKYLVHIARDITRQKKLEEDLFQSHKMEAIGTLAGGVAHDFNNILSAIIGFSELAKDSIPTDNAAQKDIDTVIASSLRAADLVSQILTFSRKSTNRLQPLMPHLIVKEVLKMLRSSLPTTLSLEEKIDPDCGLILADTTNVHQIVMNLCTNAYHAMENEKGTLAISLFRKDVEAERISQNTISPGSFIVLSVSDTGHGMDKKTVNRIFEPYFTTKEVGKGIGLGLAVIHRIVKDYNGFIEVESEPGKGSTFLVHFPAIEKAALSEKTAVKGPLPGGNEQILIVDDEASIVNLQKTMLERLGYTITSTTNSRDALEEIRLNPDQFNLLITDQTMPYLSGIELAEEVLKIRPNMPVILCTGYSSVITEEGALAIGIKKYLKKPVNRSILATITRQVLDEAH